MEDITDADYKHTKGVCKDFQIKNLRRISWFVCSKQYIIVSRRIWEISQYVSWNIWTRHCSFSYCTRICMASSLKKDWSKIRYFIWYRMLFIVEKDMRERICHAIYWYAKANN